MLQEQRRGCRQGERGGEGEGVGLVGMTRERIKVGENVGGGEEQKMKGRGEEINLTLTSAKQLEQITPIIQERCVEELCGPLALRVSKDVLAPHKCVCMADFMSNSVCVCVCRRKGQGRGKEVY